jgi:hypothetical protein
LGGGIGFGEGQNVYIDGLAHSLEEEKALAAFEYEKNSQEKFVIKKLKDQYLFEVTVPENTEVVANEAFKDGKFSKISLPSTLRWIGDRAFMGCKRLKTITLPKSVQDIGDEAFKDCELLTIEIGKDVTVGKDAIANTATDKKQKAEKQKQEEDRKRREAEERQRREEERKRREAEERQRQLKAEFQIKNGVLVKYTGNSSNVTIPNSVKSIGSYAFQYCGSLKSVTIPNSVTSIGDDAFFNCSSLTSVTIPDSVTSIGKWAFFNCSSLKSVTIPKNYDVGGYEFPSTCQVIRR